MIFNGQIRYLAFYKYFFDSIEGCRFFCGPIFVWILLLWAWISFVYLLLYPREMPAYAMDKKNEKKLFKIIGKESKK